MQHPGRRNGCGDYGAALPYHDSCGDLMPRFNADAVRFRVLDAQPVHSLRPEGLRWWQVDVWKADGDLDASGNIRVFDYARTLSATP